MWYIVIGVFGLLCLYLFDLVSLKRLPGVKPVTWLLGSGLLIYAALRVCLSQDKLLLPAWSIWLGWGLFSLAFFLLIYSLFISLPFCKTYINIGSSNQLMTIGLYALVRHPGVHWFIFVLFSLVLVSKSRLLVIAAPVWILLNILLVIIQDRFLLGRLFAGYDSYRRQTPMLLPNRKSLHKFIKTG